MRLITQTLIPIIIFLTPSVFNAQNAINNDSAVAKYLLIRPTRSMANQLRKPNSVMLINDFREITKTQALFKNNSAYAHRCGTQWLIDFWKDETSLVDEIAFNGNCEQYEHSNKQILATIKEFTNRIESTPPQYLYNLKIPADILPKTVLEKMSNEHNIFFIYGMFQHLPSLTMRVVMTDSLPKERVEIAKMEEKNKKMGKLRMDSLIAKIDNLSKIDNIGRITNPTSGSGNNEIEDVFEVTLKLKQGADLTKIEQFINANGGNIQDKKNPDFYFVQLVSTQKTVGAVNDFILPKYDFIKEIFEYPNKK
jgi:hypothetical protein